MITCIYLSQCNYYLTLCLVTTDTLRNTPAGELCLTSVPRGGYKREQTREWTAQKRRSITCSPTARNDVGKGFCKRENPARKFRIRYNINFLMCQSLTYVYVCMDMNSLACAANICTCCKRWRVSVHGPHNNNKPVLASIVTFPPTLHTGDSVLPVIYNFKPFHLLPSKVMFVPWTDNSGPSTYHFFKLIQVR